MNANSKCSPVFFARLIIAALCAAGLHATASAAAQPAPSVDDGLRAFEVVRSVLQHPRCRNCHVPGDAPLQGDDGVPHDQGIVRGVDGHGAPANECSSCHLDRNLPLSYGPNAPPGSPDWHLPPPELKMVFHGLTPNELCVAIKDERLTRGRNLAAMMAHIRDNRQVAWGWAPGTKRATPPATRAATVAAFKTWMNAGAPCPQ
jgi:hypothetical protein